MESPKRFQPSPPATEAEAVQGTAVWRQKASSSGSSVQRGQSWKPSPRPADKPQAAPPPWYSHPHVTVRQPAKRHRISDRPALFRDTHFIKAGKGSKGASWGESQDWLREECGRWPQSTPEPCAKKLANQSSDSEVHRLYSFSLHNQRGHHTQKMTWEKYLDERREHHRSKKRQRWHYKSQIQPVLLLLPTWFDRNG